MKHTWTYANMGGNTRVIIKNGKDIQHLAELDEKLWTVLACPVSGLEIPDESLALIDHNHDAKIHIQDVVATAQWHRKLYYAPQHWWLQRPIARGYLLPYTQTRLRR